MPDFDLTVSLVLYHTDRDEIENVINIVNQSPLKTKIYVIDNSATDELKSITEKWDVEYIFNDANLGYGTAHNIAIRKAKDVSKYHLVMNCDVHFEPEVLKKAFDFMEANTDVGLVSPMIKLPNGELLYFCRMMVTPLVLFGRRFVPSFMLPLIQKKLDNFLLKHKDYSKQMVVPNLPGSFMFMRTSTVNNIGGFDENFFMYVEDIDLSRRLYEVSKTVYNPEMVIEHRFERGSYSVFKLMRYHINSQIYYFNKWGWFFDAKRDEANKALL